MTSLDFKSMEFTYNFKASKPNILPYAFSIFLTLVGKTQHTYISKKHKSIRTKKDGMTKRKK